MKAAVPPDCLRLRDHLQGERGFAGRLGPENLHYPSAREASDAQSGIERNGAARDHRDRQHVARSETQHRAFSELLVHLAQGGVNGALARGGVNWQTLIFHASLVWRCLGLSQGVWAADI